MAVERTFSIIKPDATQRNLTGKIIDRFEFAGLRVVASKRIHMSKEQAEGFYAVHKERPFFNDLVSFMISGPVVVQVLEGKMRLHVTAKLWVQPTPLMRLKALFVKILPRALRLILSMDRMRRKQRLKKFATSLAMRKSSAKR